MSQQHTILNERNDMDINMTEVYKYSKLLNVKHGDAFRIVCFNIKQLIGNKLS